MSPTAEAARQPVRDQNIRLRIFLPLVAAGVLLMAAFLGGAYWKTTREISQDVERDISRLNVTFELVLEGKTSQMKSLLDTFDFSPAPSDLFVARKRDDLQAWVKQRYANLLYDQHITHLYFHDLERRCFLRVHQPERHGDVINRTTLLEAEHTGQPTSGIELGPLGTLTLRTVVPWRRDGRLVGYLEMGQEIESIADRVAAMQKLDLVILVKKQFLKQADWESGMQMLQHRASWSQFPEWVLVYPTVKDLPGALTAFLTTNPDLLAQRFFFSSGNRSFLVAAEPFKDVAAREIGGRLVVYDVTGAMDEGRSLVIFAGVVIIAVAGLLFSLLYVYLGRLEGNLLAARRRSAEESLEREAIQQRHLEALGRAQEELEGKILERTAALMDSNEMLHREIVERKQAEKSIRLSEEKYRSLFEESRDAIIIITPSGALVDANPAAVELFGCSSREELLSLTVDDFYADPGDRASFQSLIEERGFVQNHELQLKKRDGAQIQVVESATAVRDELGVVTAYRRVLRDITELKRFEKQFYQAQKMESIGTLAGGLAHDFNNILSGILCYASLIKLKVAKDHPFFNYVDTIEKGAKRAAELTAQLLAFGRGGKFEIKPVDINEIIGETQTLIGRTFDKAIEIKVNLQRPLPTVEGDAGQLQQMLTNLCLNARDAMPNGGLLSIATSVEHIGDEYLKRYSYTKPGVFVVLAVSDTGIGMDKATLEKIFEPFFTTKGQGKGTGLGLAMVYGVVKNHGGWVNVYSEPGFGTIFKIYLPASLKAPILAVKGEAEASTGNEVVLVVDDEDMIREMLKETLESFNYRVLLAHNGTQALKLYSEFKDEIDLVILDMVMPLMGGEETFAGLKQIDPGVRVILSSGYSKEGRAQTIIDGGIRGFIQKPYEVDALLRAIRSALANPSPA